MRAVEPVLYDRESLDDYVGPFRLTAISLTQTATFWVPQQKPTIPVRMEDELRRHGFEYAAPVHGSDPDNKGMSNGDLERRMLFLDVFNECVTTVDISDPNLDQWHECTLRRMSRFRLERVAASVKRDKKFSVDGDAGKAHQDVLLLTFCGLQLKKKYALQLSTLFEKDDHPLKPPIELEASNWDNFVKKLTDDSQSSDAESVVSYAKSLVEFLIPSYVYTLGAIPDPTLWCFDFSAADLEDLYHGNCDQTSVARVIESLKGKSCLGPVAVNADDVGGVLRHQRNLAYHTHVLLLGLQHNEKRLQSLLFDNKLLLEKLDQHYDSELTRVFGSIHYLLTVRREAQLSRKCKCANRLVWHRRGEDICIGGLQHHFFDEKNWISDYFSEFSLNEPNSKLLEEKISKEVGAWPIPFLTSVVKTLDRNYVESELNSNTDFASQLADFTPEEIIDIRLALFLGCGAPTRDPHRGEGYDRMIHVVTSTIRKLVLDVRLCHENARALATKYWHFSGADLHLINVPYDLNAIVVSQSLHDTFSITDVGLDLHGLFSTTNEHSDALAATLIKLSDTRTPSGSAQQYELLGGFLVETTKSKGSFVLHGFCDGVEGLTHEVRITVSQKKTVTIVNELEDLEFVVRLDNENLQKSTVTTLNANQRLPPNAFLRLGILLHDTGLSIGPDEVVAESGDCLIAALDGEQRLASGEELLTEHKSRALQLSPTMLALLPRTNVELQKILCNIFEILPVIERLFFRTTDREVVGVLGLSHHEVPIAMSVLSDASFAMTTMTIDEESFPTKYGVLQELSSTSGISIVPLTLVSPLSDRNIKKLVNLTRRTSLRLVLEASKLTSSFFDDQTATFTTVELKERRIVDVVASSRLGQLFGMATEFIRDENMLSLLKQEAKEVCTWAERQYESLTADAPTLFQNGKSTTSHTKLVIIVNDGLKVSSGTGDETNTDVVYRSLGRPMHLHDQVQEILWNFPRKQIIVAVHHLDLSSTAFYVTRARDAVMEPMSIFRPDLCIPPLTTDSRVAKILGCSVEDLDTKPRAAKLIAEIRKHDQSTTLPSFQAYIMRSSISEFLPHRMRLALYFKFVLELRLSWDDTSAYIASCCHNIATPTIWDSIATGEEPIHHLPSYELVLPPGSVTTAINHAMESAMREGSPISEQLMEEWLEHRPSPTSLRRFMFTSLNPLSLFVLNPAAVVSAIQSTSSNDVSDHLPFWAARLQDRLRSPICTHFLGPILSVVRWIVHLAGGDDAVTYDDLEHISALIEDICLPVSKSDLTERELSLLRMVFSLDADGGLATQYMFKRSLQVAPSDGGMSTSATDAIFRATSPLGALFVRAFLDADVASALLRRNVHQLHQIKRWVVADDNTVPLDFATNVIAQRFTPAAWAELMLSVAEGNINVREKVIMLINVWKTKENRNDAQVVEWCCKRRGSKARADHVIRLVSTTLGMAIQICPSKGYMWPLDPLDSSEERSTPRRMRIMTNSERVATELCNEAHSRFHRGTGDMASNFSDVVDYIRATTDERLRVKLLRTLVQELLVGFSCDSCHHDKDDCTIWVFAALWILAPTVSCRISPADEDVVKCLSAYVNIPGVVQAAFAETVKKYRHIVPPLALALIGWVEYVPTSMMVRLSQIEHMWSGQIQGVSMRSFILLRPPPATRHSFVVLCNRPLPREISDALTNIVQGVMQLGADENATPRVSEGFSENIFIGNLQYLRRCIASNDEDDLHKAELVALWFWCLGFYTFPPEVELFIQTLRGRRFDDRSVDMTRASISPVVLDVHAQRPFMSDLFNVSYFDTLSEALLPAFPGCPDEDWSFSAASEEAAVEGLVNVSISRYKSFCGAHKSIEWKLILANELTRLCRMLESEHPTLSNKLLRIVTAAANQGESHLQLQRTGFSGNVANVLHPDTDIFSFPNVPYCPSKAPWRAEFPETTHRMKPQATTMNLTTTLRPRNILVPAQESVNDRGKESTEDLHHALLRSQFSARSIDVSLILMLEVANKDSFCLTLKVTPGSVCYFAEEDANLKITNSLSARRELASFKSHGHAWNFCRSFRGPMTLVGKGFFLYRAKDSASEWRCFIGRSQPQPQYSSDFLFWHISAFHNALSLSLPPPLEKLLLRLCSEVYDYVSLNDQLPLDDRKKIEALVNSNAADFKAYRDSAEPLLAFTRLLIRAADFMRSSEEPQFSNSDQTAPARVGTVHDAVSDVLQQMIAPQPAPPLRQADVDSARNSAAWIGQQAMSSECFADIQKTREPVAIKRIVKALEKTAFREAIEECVRSLSSIEDSKFALFVLSERCDTYCCKLQHVKLAFEPLIADDAWQVLTKWSNASVADDAALRVRNNGTSENDEKKKVRAALIKRRKRFEEQNRAMRTPVKSTHVGEGVVDRLESEVDFCWTHLHNDDDVDKDLLPQPHIIWKDYDPDGFSINAGETVAHVMDVLLCCYSDEVPSETRFKIEHRCDDRLTLAATNEGGDIVTIPGMANHPHVNNPTYSTRFKKIIDEYDELFARLLLVTPDPRAGQWMLASTETGWALERPDSSNNRQYHEFVPLEAPPQSTSAAGGQLTKNDAIWPFMFRWIAMMIESPLSPEAKSFFLHHTHVSSLNKAPVSDMLSMMMYCVAQRCPAPRLRDRLLGALFFIPSDLCLRRDRTFGVIMIRGRGLPKDWNTIPNRRGPISLDHDNSQAEQFRTIVKKFSTYTTHVAIEGMNEVPDQLLKLCCEHTKDYPWRFIVFIEASCDNNIPENRDRVVTIGETFPPRIVRQKIEFDDGINEAFIEKLKDTKNIDSNRRVDWVSRVSDFVDNEKEGNIVLLVGSPGAGKTTELRYFQDTRKDVKFVTFDCSGSSLVYEPLVTLLDKASLGIELGAAPVFFVADEYHFLKSDKKNEFQRWASTKINSMGFILISNRKDSNDEAFDKRMGSLSSSPSSIIWSSRVSAAKMHDALQNVPMNAPATIDKGVAFLCTIRTLFSDDVVSLRMATDMCDSPYGQPRNMTNKPSTTLELSLWSKLQRENDTFAVAVVRSFDKYYDQVGSKPDEDIIAAYNNVQDPIDFLVFTAMLPVMLTDATIHDKVASYVEVVEELSAYSVHPAIRLAAWVQHTVEKVATSLPHPRTLICRKLNEIIALTRKLEIADDPTFFPVIYGVRGMSDLNKCELFAFSDALEPRDMLEAFARHEAFHWKKIKDHWFYHPVYDLESIMKLSECVPPTMLLGCLTPENAYHLVQQGLRESSSYSFHDIVLKHYPKQSLELEGGVTSPYFFCLWHRARSQPIEDNGKLWASEVENYLPPRRMARFVHWVVTYGELSAGDVDSSRAAAHAVGTLAEEHCSDEENTQLWRCDRMAPLATISTDTAPGGAMSLDRAKAITSTNQPPHPFWPVELKALCGRSASSAELAHIPSCPSLLSVPEASPY
ncbi:Hypothetical protein, putative [Bodo saltans]|uniref:AAA+ ATPase domain-containing protein n=1 Tax=Bodo saltans TaxID=75058 RepID=A0A0S4JKD7_BODSA|nr:Hypothetical protein, putative [Bodo saltans]|eukprot:CUG91987.1 Hypothetical protein, putative [Bodo saltans]